MRKSLAWALTAALLACGTPALARAETRAGDDPETAASRAVIENYALLRSERRTHLVPETFNQPDRIEHNPEIGDGIYGDKVFLTRRGEEKPQEFGQPSQYVNVIHTIMADGELVAVKSHLFSKPDDPGREFIDIWRIRDGKFAEHWDVIQPLSAGAEVACGVGATYEAARQISRQSASQPVCGLPDPAADGEANRARVLRFLELEQRPERLVEAVENYLSPEFVEHDASTPAGRRSLVAYLAARMAERQDGPAEWHDGRVLADGNLVLVHRRLTTPTNARGVAVADLFRLKEGKITDHWGVRQPIPEFSVAGHAMVEGELEPERYVGRERPAQ